MRLYTWTWTSGQVCLTGYLRSLGLWVKRRRVRECLARLDPQNRALGWGIVVSRRVYRVPWPNSLWHLDRHHSLIHYKLIINGGVEEKGWFHRWFLNSQSRDWTSLERGVLMRLSPFLLYFLCCGIIRASQCGGSDSALCIAYHSHPNPKLHDLPLTWFAITSAFQLFYRRPYQSKVVWVHDWWSRNWSLWLSISIGDWKCQLL